MVVSMHWPLLLLLLLLLLRGVLLLLLLPLQQLLRHPALCGRQPGLLPAGVATQHLLLLLASPHKLLPCADTLLLPQPTTPVLLLLLLLLLLLWWRQPLAIRLHV
jgi:hypothetical protein